MPPPPITLLLAIYNPNLHWLRQLLLSLNAQTCPNLSLLARDDASSSVSLHTLRSLLAQTITAFPWRLEQNPKNLGSTATFESLTRQATGEFLAYCDQDDIWCPQKILALRDALLHAPSALLACSDMTVIDASGRTIAPSITHVRPDIHFRSGPGLAEGLLYRNFVTGAAMLVRTAPAKASLPFIPGWYHDQHIAFHCALHGTILSLPKPLLRYRLHPHNQTGPLHHVHSPADYYASVLHPFTLRLHALASRYPHFAPITTALDWANAREANYARKPHSFRRLFALRHHNPPFSWFELLALRLPPPLFPLATATARACYDKRFLPH